jgi:hypothetical protein
MNLAVLLNIRNAAAVTMKVLKILAGALLRTTTTTPGSAIHRALCGLPLVRTICHRLPNKDLQRTTQTPSKKMGALAVAFKRKKKGDKGNRCVNAKCTKRDFVDRREIFKFFAGNVYFIEFFRLSLFQQVCADGLCVGLSLF